METPTDGAAVLDSAPVTDTAFGGIPETADPVFREPEPTKAEAPARTPSIYLALPTAGSIDALALSGLVQPSRHPVHMVPTRGEAGVYNHLWCNALNARQRLQLTHYASQHSDVQLPPYWIDCLLHRKEKVGADIISAVISIKDDRGTTSTAVRNNKTRTIRRLTRKEVEKLPETFCLTDIPWANPDDALLINNGAWLCDFTQPWVEEVCFHFHEWIAKFPDGTFASCFFSEDWQFSEWATVKGLKLYATKLPNLHCGRKEFNALIPEATDWDEEKGDEMRT